MLFWRIKKSVLFMRHLLVLLLTGYVFISFSQTTPTVTEFKNEPASFIKDLDLLLNSTKREDCKQVYEAFANLIKTNKIPSEQLEKIVAISNFLLREKMRAHPHFFNYFNTLNALFTSGKNAVHFSSWNDVVYGLLMEQKKGNYKDFMEFMDFSKALFEKNAIYDSRAKIWIASSEDYKLSFENKKPKVTFSATDITCYSSQDTQKILNTSGTLFPLEYVWNGSKGKVDWSRVGLPEVYADITKKYTIRFDQSDIKIDTVTFYYKQLFKTSLQGSYFDKSMTQQGNRSYPRFNSFDKNLDIGDIGPNIKYTGGFGIQGDNIYGAGDDTHPSTITFFSDNGKKVLTARATQFLIKKGEELASSKSEISLYMGNDSIYHPGVRLVYKFDKKELSLYRSRDGISASPFYDSFHKKELQTDAIVWKLNEPNIDLKMLTGAGQNAMELTSDNYFQKGELEKYQTTKDFSPVHRLKRYSEELNSRDFLAENFAKSLDPGYTESTIKNLLFKLMEGGFIFYEPATGVISVTDKTFNFVQAHSGKKDYDIIKIKSFSDKTNAKINIENNEMEIAGVGMITLSDTANVHIFPKDKNITVKKDQDMDFSGKIFAGRIDFEGEGFVFDYDSFRIDMEKLASATINIPSGKKDKKGESEYVAMKSKIEGLTGFLNIDHPKNKSGKQRIEKYPIFTNRKNSYVYYDRKEIRDSAYLRSKFYFEIEPFVFDSLNSFDPYLADLKGQLVSAGIFPNFKEMLRVQEDLSWGFNRMTPEAGFPIYGGKGTYTDSILLSNKGLQGRGHVRHLFIDFNSHDILFTPDSLNAVSDTFLMKKDKTASATFPLVRGKDNFIHWMPYKDSMHVKTRSQPLSMYEEGATLKGDLLFTTKGLTGNGRFEFAEASLESQMFKFSSEQLQSDTMGMEIKSIGGNEVTFKTPNVRGKVDFVKRQGEFKANNEDIPTEFTNNFFKTNINEFFWDMDNRILDFKSPKGSPGAYFTSTHAQKDSLRFMAKRGIFDMTNSIINVEDVSRFFVADAEIIPDSFKATILPGGNIDTLYKAQIIADTSSRYHKIYDATLYVAARNNYTGTGKYDYRYGDMKMIINLSKIGVKEDKLNKKKLTYTTFAEGLIEEADSFKIHPSIDFKGMATFTAKDTGVTFDGFAKMKIGDVQTDWFSFKDKIDPKNFMLHYNKPVTPSGDTLTAGFGYTFTGDDAGLYMRMMTPKKGSDDMEVFATKGILTHDAAKKIYYFGDENKIVKSVPKGNVFQYNEKTKIAVAEGKVDLGLQLNPVSIISSGNITHKVDSNKHILKLLLGLNLPVEKTLMAQFAADVNSFSFDKPNVDLNNAYFESAYAEMFSDKGYKSKLEELRKTGSFPVNKELGNIVFSHLTLVFDPNFQIYRSVGPIGIAYIGEVPIMKMINGTVEFGQRKFNDFFNIYIESSFSDWYFISYQNNTLQMISSKEDFNKLLAAIPVAKRQIPITKDKKFFFLYTIGTAGSKEAYLYRMKMIADAKFDMSSDDKDEQYYMNQELYEIKKQLLRDEQTIPQDQLIIQDQMIFGKPEDGTDEPPLDRESPDQLTPEDAAPVEQPKKKGKKGAPQTESNEPPLQQEEREPTMIFELPSEPVKQEEIKEEPPVEQVIPEEAAPKKKEKKTKATSTPENNEPPVQQESPVIEPVQQEMKEEPKQTIQEEVPVEKPATNETASKKKEKKPKATSTPENNEPPLQQDTPVVEPEKQEPPKEEVKEEPPMQQEELPVSNPDEPVLEEGGKKKKKKE
jgi:hypothetical protein